MVGTPVTIRVANPDDQPALATLARLDTAAPLTLPVIVAEIGGELRAALSLADSRVIADPFHLTGELVDLLRVRAQQLTAASGARRFTALRSVLASALPRATTV